MKSLKERQAQRDYFAKVNRGDVKDTVVSLGESENGDVIGDDGKPVAGTAAKGRNTSAGDGKDGTTSDGAPEGQKKDWSKVGKHDDLNAGLGSRTAPEGWADWKVEAKQEWLTANENPTGASGWN